ncbi:MAG: metallophosphatase family protein [Myxococcales bacterium]|jgi:diadenosine tetraphosphatase ApaH/serine/threonine PP2A family protein phosphatase|nr:metallophosphatase family protein [Myxococcales bacterium]
MRIAIISDIHSNLEALLATKCELEHLDVDRIICLGDVVGYGASPEACCALIRNMTEITLLGNHDAAVSRRMDYGAYYEAARQVLDWTAAQLSSPNLAWLRSLPYAYRFGDLCFSHGAPLRPEAYEYIFTIEQLEELLPHYEALSEVTFIGHSHMSKAFALSEGGEFFEARDPIVSIQPGRKYVISVGSIGQPRDYDNRSCFVVYDTAKRIAQFHRVEYDIETSARRIFEADLALNFGKRLFLGI